MKLSTLSFLLAAGLSLGACATTEKAAESGIANANKELSSATSDAEKSADYAEKDAKNTTEGDGK